MLLANYKLPSSQDHHAVGGPTTNILVNDNVFSL